MIPLLAGCGPDPVPGPQITISGDLVDHEIEGVCDGVGSLIVEGSVEVQGGPILEDLTALRCLTQVDGDLLLEQLSGLRGLGRLTSVGGSLSVMAARSESGHLAELGALRSVQHLHLSLSDLDDLHGLASLETVTDSLSLSSMSLRDLATPHLVVPRQLQVTNLTVGDFSGLRIPETLDRLSMIQHYPGPLPRDLHGFEPLRRVTGDVRLEGFASLVGLGGLERVGGDLTLRTDGSAEGLGSLASVGGGLSVSGLASTRLTGLEGVRTVGSLVLMNNEVLTDVSVLRGLEHVSGDVVIAANPALSTAAAWALVDAIPRIDGTVEVYGNAP